MSEVELYNNVLSSFHYLGYKIKTKVKKHDDCRFIEHYVFMGYTTLIILNNIDAQWFRYGSLESETLKLTKLHEDDMEEYSAYLFELVRYFKSKETGEGSGIK